VANEVSVGAILACDPAMCAVLARYGVPAGNLLVLGPAATDPLGSDVVLATAAVRGTFGSRLTSVYAPMIMASFGTGQARIDVLAVAPDGAPAYLTALAADLRARRAAGRQLLQDPRLRFSPSARAQLTAGQPDARLLMTLAALTVSGPVQVLGFGDAGPRATRGMPLRAVQIAVPAAAAPNILAFLRAQRPPYLAAHVGIDEPTDRTAPTARSVLTIEFAAPAPLGLLQPQPSH
jgi:hypothetical protein